MAIHEVDIFFYRKKCPSESETVFVDYNFELGTGLASLIKMYEPETTQRRDSFSIYLLY